MPLSLADGGVTAVRSGDLINNIENMKLSVKYILGSSSATLSPGKTMLFLGASFYQDETLITNNDQYQKSLSKGNIEAVIVTKNPNPSSGAPYSGASVLTMAGSDTYALIKKIDKSEYDKYQSNSEVSAYLKNDNSNYFMCIDVSGSLWGPQTGTNGQLKPWNVYHGFSEDFAESRYDGIIYPQQKYVAGHWKVSCERDAAAFGSNISPVNKWTKTSIGSRYSFWE